MAPCARWYPLAPAMLLAGCGYVGEPLPPSLNIPTKVGDLAVSERADKLVIGFEIPGLTTDGVPLRVGEVDLRIGPEADNWVEQARRIDTGAREPGAVRLEIPARDWVGREIVAGVRVSSRRGRFSEWSNLVRLRVVPPLAAPSGVRAESDPRGVKLSWQGGAGGVTWRVFRKAPQDKEAAAVAETQAPELVDTTAEYGKTYEYAVQALLNAGDARAESEPSAPVAIAPIDTFPPAVPAGLTAVSAAGSIELTWNPNAEPDLRGYYVYRAPDGQDFQRAGDLVPTPNYSDRGVESGQRYRYEVSAVDQAGNESARSTAVEAAAQ